MTTVQINATCSSGSTGKICAAVSGLLTDKGIKNYVLYSTGASPLKNAERYASDRMIKTGALSSRIFGSWGFEGTAATRRLISLLERIQPDVIHLHNLHNHACRLDMLFQWIKKRKIRVLWTFHDCWAFTGYCMHYEGTGCDKWKTGCGDCPQKSDYSWLFDKSGELYDKKRRLFDGLDLTVIAPSEWMANQVKRSFLSGYPCRVIQNGIDLSVFRPTACPSDGSAAPDGRFTVLGVSNIWSERKGADAFIRLSKMLDERYRIVLVGADGDLLKRLPSEITAVGRTKDQSELAMYYTSADVFVNPSEEETFPTVNIEALACGTPVVTYDVGGSPEIIDGTCGSVVPKNDISALAAEIRRVCEEKPFSSQACLDRAAGFDQDRKFKEYITLYEGLG